MRNFVIFFHEKEGTSPLVRLLDNFDQVSIVHQENNSGWEPFDRHNCGPMPLKILESCLEIVLGKAPVDVKQLNQLYTETAKLPVAELNKNGVVGFKMRFVPPDNNAPFLAEFSPWNRLYKRFAESFLRRMMIDLLSRNDVVVFMAVRQDVLRWGLSKYHGDGTGKPGHLQFKLASGQISRGEIDKVTVDCSRLEKIIATYEEEHVRKRLLLEEFERAGIRTCPLIYEEFLADKHKYFSQIFDFLDLQVSSEQIDVALNEGEYFKKVHSDDISDFVENHEEVKEKFADRFISWR